MKTRSRRVLLSVTAGALVVLLAIAAVWWWSPMRDVGFAMWRAGPLGRGMMREIHGMGDVDSEYEYLSRMIPHHEEAVVAARALRDARVSPDLSEFAAGVIEVQSREIDRFTGWLSRWHADRPVRADYDPMMRDLDGLRGERLARAFLEDMIPHHMAAVMMSQQLLAANFERHPEVGALAEQIRDTQLREIRWMGDRLRELQ